MKYMLILFSAFFLVACESESLDNLRPAPEEQPIQNPNDTAGTDTTGTNQPTVSFARDIKPLIEQKCATSGCHTANANFPALETYTQIESSKERIKARAVEPNGGMPFSGPLPQIEKDKISTWITEGAMNN